MLKEDVIPQKELNLYETETFFNNHIQSALEHTAQDKHKSLEELELQCSHLLNKNDL